MELDIKTLEKELVNIIQVMTKDPLLEDLKENIWRFTKGNPVHDIGVVIFFRPEYCGIGKILRYISSKYPLFVEHFLLEKEGYIQVELVQAEFVKT